MATWCTPTQFPFHTFGRREVVARFDAGHLTIDAVAQIGQGLNRDCTECLSASIVEGRYRQWTSEMRASIRRALVIAELVPHLAGKTQHMPENSDVAIDGTHIDPQVVGKFEFDFQRASPFTVPKSSSRARLLFSNTIWWQAAPGTDADKGREASALATSDKLIGSEGNRYWTWFAGPATLKLPEL